MAGGERIDFASWREEFVRAVESGGATSVPCAGCTACCRSAQFVHVEPDEADTLAHLDPALLVPAPGRPAGHMVMGFDDAGRCPMLGDSGCRIYEHRPRTCRTYDCRVFAASGLEPDKPLIAARVKDWRFGAAGDRGAVTDRARELRAAGCGAAEAAVRAVLEAGAGPSGSGPAHLTGDR